MSQPVIRIDHLTKKFGDEVAVNEATFDVPAGTIFGFIGPSGSGKTTLVRLLTGVLTPSAGKAVVLGREPIHFKQATREQIGYMPQLFVLYPQLTVWENLNFAASIYGMGFRRGKRLKDVLEFVELYEHRRKRVRDISGGMQRRLSLAATLVHNPALIFWMNPLPESTRYCAASFGITFAPCAMKAAHCSLPRNTSARPHIAISSA